MVLAMPLTQVDHLPGESTTSLLAWRPVQLWPIPCGIRGIDSSRNFPLFVLAPPRAGLKHLEPPALHSDGVCWQTSKAVVLEMHLLSPDKRQGQDLPFGQSASENTYRASSVTRAGLLSPLSNTWTPVANEWVAVASTNCAASHVFLWSSRCHVTRVSRHEGAFGAYRQSGPMASPDSTTELSVQGTPDLTISLQPSSRNKFTRTGSVGSSSNESASPYSGSSLRCEFGARSCLARWKSSEALDALDDTTPTTTAWGGLAACIISPYLRKAPRIAISRASSPTLSHIVLRCYNIYMTSTPTKEKERFAKMISPRSLISTAGRMAVEGFRRWIRKR